MSTAGGADKAIDRACSIDCTAMQIFVKSNMQWFAPAPFAEADLRAFHEHNERARLSSILATAAT
jgi:endonuclease IV